MELEMRISHPFIFPVEMFLVFVSGLEITLYMLLMLQYLKLANQYIFINLIQAQEKK